MADIELAWAAGFFDGEGSSTGRHETAPRFTIAVSQKDRRPLERFVAALGVGARIYEGRLFSVVLGGAKGIEAMRRLWPYLSEPKREQARAVLADVMARRSRRYPKLNKAYDDFWKEIQP